MYTASGCGSGPLSAHMLSVSLKAPSSSHPPSPSLEPSPASGLAAEEKS